MEGKVLLYDSNGAKIGETFFRRAKQLVKQQRASWTSEKQDAICFSPGMENLDESLAEDASESGSGELLMESLYAEDELMKLAKRRVRAAIAFKLHRGISLILIVFFVAIFVASGSDFVPVFILATMLGLSVAIHWVVYKVVNEVDINIKIADEYQRLKRRR